MANEIQVVANPGSTVYCLIRNTSGQVYSTVSQTFGAYATASYANYTVSMSEQGTASGYFTANFPTAVTTSGSYNIVAYRQLGGSPSQSDPPVGYGTLEWSGSSQLSLADVVTSGFLSRFLPVRLARGQMVQNFPLYLKSSADHVTPLTSGSVSGQIARDGGAFGALQSGTVTEVGLGFYTVSLTSGDLNANTVSLLFTAAGADPLPLGFVLQRNSG